MTGEPRLLTLPVNSGLFCRLSAPTLCKIMSYRLSFAAEFRNFLTSVILHQPPNTAIDVFATFGTGCREAAGATPPANTNDNEFVCFHEHNIAKRPVDVKAYFSNFLKKT
jgi:hypothetical protein